MRNLLKHADMLVSPYEFNVNQRQKSLTVVGNNVSELGGVLSIVVGIFSIFYMAGVIQKTLEDQQTIYVGTQNSNINQINLNSNNSIIALEISDLKGNIFENITELQEYFDINIQFIQQTRDNSKIGYTRIRTNISMIKCDSSVIDEFNFDLIAFSSEKKSNMYCSQGEYNIAGSFFDKSFSYLKVQINVCNSSSNCLPIETIKEKIQSGINVDLFFKGAKLKDEFDITAPIEAYPENVYQKLVTGVLSSNDIYVTPLQMVLCKLLIQQPEKNEIFSNLLNIQGDTVFSATTIEKQNKNQEPIEFGEGVTLCSFYLRSSSSMQYYLATQSDLFTVFSSSLSQATALAVAIMSFLKLFYHSYNQHKTFAVLMNSVFKFDLDSVKKKRQSSMYQTVDQHEPQNESKKTLTPVRQGTLQQILNFEISYSFIKYLKYTLFKIGKSLNYTLFKTDKEVIISQIAKSKIQYDLDLTNILKKLYEIDCLKLFFFDDDQLVLFNTFCSPVFQDGMANQKDLYDILTNQQQQQKILSNSQVQEKEKRFDLTFVASSEIPINVRLARVARFFKAQLGAPNAEGLVKTFQRIKENANENTAQNQRLLDFTKQNSSLFRLVQSQYEHVAIKSQTQNIVPDEICEDEIRQHSESKDPVISGDAQSYEIESNKKSDNQLK